MSRITIVEIDIPRCSRTYGTAPCTAAVGVTGADRCFNSARTCQDRDNFDPSDTHTLRYCEPGDIPDIYQDGTGVPVTPALQAISFTPAKVNPGVDVGMRESVNVMLKDHLHTEAGIDPYRTLRSYDPYELGNLWPRLRARYPSLQGAPLRVIRGETDEDTSDMVTRHYLVDKFTVNDGSVSIVAKDVLILAEDKKAQAPVLSSGTLLVDVAAAYVGTFALTPAGVGSLEYPATGEACIGGKEVVSFTRSGDTIDIVARGLYGTEDIDHDAGEQFQLVLHYDSVAPSEIIADLLMNYVEGFDASWIDQDAWTQDVDSYVARLYSAVIVEPTSVVSLVNEIIQQVGIILAWDSVNEQLWLSAIKPLALATDATHTTDNIVEGSFSIAEQPEKRASEVWTYYGQRNPTEELSEPRNYSVAVASVDNDAATDYYSPAIKKIFSRWIASDGRAIALQINAMLLARYRDPPRKFTYSVFDIADVPGLGSSIYIKHWMLVDAYGTEVKVPVQICSLDSTDPAMTKIVAEEANFTAQEDLGGGTGTGGTTDRYIYIDSPLFNVNLRSLHDSMYLTPDATTVVIVVVNAAVGSLRNSALPALDIGSWPAGASISITLNAPISGAGGDGENSVTLTDATDGTDGLYTRYAVTITNNSYIAGGGGGAGAVFYVSAQGGGGAGIQAGMQDPAILPQPTALTGGYPGGGDAGADGNTFGTSGAAGTAVDGDSYVTYSLLGTIYGARVN